MLQKIVSSLATAVMVILGATAAYADGPVNKTWLGTAIDGIDPVAYFLESRPVDGDSDYSFEWMDADWIFASAENRDLFAADPEKYAPAYGGYCAYGVAQGSKVGFDPDAWTIVDGQLYLNLNPGIQQKWTQDIPGFVALADRNWPGLKDE